MGVGLELVFDGFGFNSPLVSAIPVLVNKFSGFVVVHGLNLSLGVFHIRTLDLKVLDEHFSFFPPETEKTQQREERETVFVFSGKGERKKGLFVWSVLSVPLFPPRSANGFSCVLWMPLDVGGAAPIYRGNQVLILDTCHHLSGLRVPG